MGLYSQADNLLRVHTEWIVKIIYRSAKVVVPPLITALRCMLDFFPSRLTACEDYRASRLRDKKRHFVVRRHTESSHLAATAEKIVLQQRKLVFMVLCRHMIYELFSIFWWHLRNGLFDLP